MVRTLSGSEGLWVLDQHDQGLSRAPDGIRLLVCASPSMLRSAKAEVRHRRASTSAHCAAKVWSLQGRGSRRSSPARRGRDGAGAGRQQPGQQRSPIVVMEPPQLGRFGRRCDGSRPHPGGRLGERPGGVFTSSLSTVLKTACPTMGSCRMWRRRKNSPAGSPLERALNLDRSPNVTNPAS